MELFPVCCWMQSFLRWQCVSCCCCSLSVVNMFLVSEGFKGAFVVGVLQHLFLLCVISCSWYINLRFLTICCVLTAWLTHRCWRSRTSRHVCLNGALTCRLCYNGARTRCLNAPHFVLVQGLQFSRQRALVQNPHNYVTLYSYRWPSGRCSFSTATTCWR